MKTKILLILCGLLLGTSSVMYAQNADRAEMRKERMKQMHENKIAFIKENVSLTEKESAAFFPLYTEYETKRMELTHQARPQGKGLKSGQKDLTEQEMEAIMDKFIQNRVEIANLEKEYYDKFKKILPASKLFQVFQADREFKQELLKDFRGRNEEAAPENRRGRGAGK